MDDDDGIVPEQVQDAGFATRDGVAVLASFHALRQATVVVRCALTIEAKGGNHGEPRCGARGVQGRDTRSHRSSGPLRLDMGGGTGTRQMVGESNRRARGALARGVGERRRRPAFEVSEAAVGVARTQRGAAPPRAAAAPQTPSAYAGPRTPDRKPDLNGIWQALGTAHWNLEAHSASEGIPAGFSVVEGGAIPYQPWALAKRTENLKNRLDDDPLRRCFMPGEPRATYLPFPFEITQTPNHIGIAYEFAHATRTIFLDGTKHLEDLDFWMGDARGKWEGDTLVVETLSLGDKTWFDEAGNFHSDALKVVERFTPTDATHLAYEATIDDAMVITKTWKLSMVVYV